MKQNGCQGTGVGGYTLIELMVTIVIVGILSAIAIPVFTSYLNKSRAQEAIQFLGVIKLRQEAYRAEFGQYCDVSARHPLNGDADTHPFSGTKAAFWADGLPPRWRQLGANPDGAVRFSFNTIAGVPGQAVPTSPGDVWIHDYDTWGIVTTDFWYVAEANGDLDGDGTTVLFGTASGMKNIWCSQAKGWE
jgi:prepilin-type N-terminal cleavage/methylation domain-containing protein